MSAVFPAEERREKRNAALNLGFWIVIGIAAVATVCSVSLQIGRVLGHQEALAEIAARPARACPMPAKALTQWQCTKQEGREYLNACATRIRMEKAGR